jgi:hypothetical protein
MILETRIKRFPPQGGITWQVKHAPRAATHWSNELDQSCATSNARRVLQSFQDISAWPQCCGNLYTLVAASRLCFSEQIVEIERAREHFQCAIGRPRPLFARAIPVKFDAVVVGIAQIKRFAHPVV